MGGDSGLWSLCIGVTWWMLGRLWVLPGCVGWMLGRLWVLPSWFWGGSWVLLGGCWVDCGCCQVGVWSLLGWVGYQWESWCRVLLGD